MEAIRIRKGQETLLPNGWRIILEPLSELRIDKSPSATSIHEAQHAFAAMLLGIGVSYMTNVPEGDSLGHTLLYQFHPVVAAAPHAMGSPGGGHDLMQIENSGHSVSAAIKSAQSLLAPYEKEILALATALDERKKLNGSEMFVIARQVKEEKEYGPMMLVRMIAPDGQEKTKKARAANDNEVIIGESDLPIQLPKAA